MSVDAARGIMVAELEGDLPEPREEEGPPHAGGERRQRVSVNPFWSSRAVGEAELNAMRPEGLPKVPDTGSSRKAEKEKDVRGGAGDAPEGDLPGREREEIGGHPEAAGSRTRTEEFWSEIRRDLTEELEEAGADGIANGGGHGPGEEGRHLGEDQERGNGAQLHGIGGGLHRGEERRPADEQGPPVEIMGRPGLMRGRPAGREGDLREPMMVDSRFARPVDEQGGQDGGRRLHGGPAPRPSEASERPRARMDLHEGQVHRRDQGTHGRDQTGREAGRAAGTGAASSSRKWTREGRGLNLDWIWNDEHKVWVPELPQRDEEELIGELDLDVEMERNYGKACRKLLGMEKQREYLFGVIEELKERVRKGQEKVQLWKDLYEKAERGRQEEVERFVTPVAEVFETPMTQVAVPLPPPPPPPPMPVARPTSRTMSTPRARTRSPTRRLKYTPGGTRVPEGEPSHEVEAVVESEKWEARWEDQRQGSNGWWYRNWSGLWNYWDDQSQHHKAETKPIDQVETGGAGAKVELPELAYDHSPLTLGDWLALVAPQMQDLSQGAAEWWVGTMEEAKRLYEVWLKSTPLERLQITVALPETLRGLRFVRTEQRGVTLLLRAIPEEIRKELISSRDISSTGVLYRLLVTYQPGGPGERTLILRKLTDLGPLRGYAEAAVALREWRRYYMRAQEIGASLPDPTLLAAALEKVTLLVNRGGPQAFRVAQARTMLGLDTTPSVKGIWSYSELLLAEMDTARLMNTETAKVKAMATGVTVEKPGAEIHAKKEASTVVCRYFGSEQGCRLGKGCKWNHDWDSIVDRNARCWICGSKQHRRAECPVKGGGKGQPAKPAVKAATHEPRDGSGGGGGVMATVASGGAGAGFAKSGQTAGATATEEETTSAAVTSTGGGTGELLAEAAHLLRSMRAPTAKAMVVIKEMNTAVVDKGLLDGGATHALRRCRDLEEWEAATPTQVILAEGTTSKMRLKEGTLTLITLEEIQPIVPMGVLTMMGYEVEWKQGNCRVKRRGKSLDVEMVDSCPMVEAEVALGLIAEMESMEEDHMMRLAAMKMPMDQLKDQPELAMTKALKEFFPGVPEEIISRVVPCMDVDGDELPWNRRRRCSALSKWMGWKETG